MNPRRVAAAIALVCSAVACSSDPKLVGGTSSVAVSSTTETAPAVTTATPVTTLPVATTTPVTTAPVTTAPVTTIAVGVMDPRLLPEPLGFDPACSEAGCTSLGVTLAGEIVAYDSATHTLTFTESGTSVAVDSTLGDLAYLVVMGPDDVAYIAGTPPSATDPVLDLVAVATSGSRAGEEVARVDGLDGSGDSTLIATATGVMQVGCCGFEARMPAAGTPVAMPWVAPGGEPSGVVVPEVHLEYPGDDTTTVVRTAVDGSEGRWTVPQLLAGRDMPAVAAAADGGALVWMYDQIGAPDTPAVLYDLRPDGTVDTFEMGRFRYVAAMHSSRFVVCTDGETYVRVALP